MNYYVKHVALPLFIGLLYYALLRPSSKFYLNLSPNAYAFPNDSLIYNAPDFLWAYAFTAALLYLWPFNKNAIIFLVMIAGLLHELSSVSLMDGTFSLLDIFLYGMGIIVAISLTRKHKSNNEKTNE